MRPILLIHGYSSEGKKNTVEDIYGRLPQDLRTKYGDNNILSINLSRWISLSDGVRLDDVSFAMQRALESKFRFLLDGEFDVIIHSTGALVIRNWIRLYSPKPSPIRKIIHLAGANFGSGLAHIGRGQLARWGRLIFGGTGRGIQVLNELEFGNWKTLDLHHHFLQPGKNMATDYQVQEYCIAGSQTLTMLRPVPIRYVKEDSADNTVRSSAVNLNYNWIKVSPGKNLLTLSQSKLSKLTSDRIENKTLKDNNYEIDLSGLAMKRRQVPFALAFETAHFGEDIGIVSGKKNRKQLMKLITRAISSEVTDEAYAGVATDYQDHTEQTLQKAAKLKNNIFEWNKQEQYEGHAQLVFRIRDQFGQAVEHFDINIRSKASGKKNKLEKMIEDDHVNSKYHSIAFYLRTMKFDDSVSPARFVDKLANIAPLDIEITAFEPDSDEISFVPLSINLTAKQVQKVVQTFCTTVIDVTLMRLPSSKVFAVKTIG